MISSLEVKGASFGENTTALPGFTICKQSAEGSESNETLRKCLDMPNDSRREKG